MIMSSDDLTGPAARASGRRSHNRWLGAVAAVGTAGLLAVAGCSSGASTPAGQGSHGSKPLSARQAIRLAANASAKVSSLTATLEVTGASGAVSGLHGTMKIQVKPTLLLDATFNVAGAGAGSNQIEEIVTNKTIYFKDAALARVAGKPWIKIEFSQLSSKLGLDFRGLVQNLESSNPLAQARLFAVSHNIHAVGTQTVDGVRCTVYKGSYEPGAALAALTPSLRKLLGPMLRSEGAQPAQFTAWIDSQHLLRKALTHEVVGGQNVTSIYTVTSINQPVTVAIPPASKIGSLPGL
jgi:hypothetical protein